MYKNSHFKEYATVIHVHANLFKNFFPPNIVQAKYYTFTVTTE